jgi:hypothetical protein
MDIPAGATVTGAGNIETTGVITGAGILATTGTVLSTGKAATQPSYDVVTTQKLNSTNGFSLVSSVGKAALTFYDSGFSAPGGVYTSGLVYYTRVGNLVTITSDTALGHNSMSDGSSSSFLPIAFRPKTTVQICSLIGGTILSRLMVSSDGSIRTTYYDWAGALNSSTSTVTPIHCSYVVID